GGWEGGRARRRGKTAPSGRRGEWFSRPAPGLRGDKNRVLGDEPLSRGDGRKPHRAEFCYRTGGETVYVCDRYPAGVGVGEYQQLLSSRPKARSWNWRPMRRNAAVYVKGRVSHPDHKTIGLDVWHQVVMNTENEARARRHVVFLD